MEMSIFLGKIFGVYFIVESLAILANRKMVKHLFKEMKHNMFLMIVVGTLAIIAGLVVISLHNLWVSNWPVIITLVGWAMFVKGFFIVVFPKHFIEFAGMFKNDGFLLFGGVISMLLGIYLCVVTF